MSRLHLILHKSEVVQSSGFGRLCLGDVRAANSSRGDEDQGVAP
jgi:hypothetical protein